MHTKFQDTLFLIKQINDKFEARGTAGCSKADLTLSQFRFLIYLKEHQDKAVTQKEMEVFFKVSHPAVNGVLKRLEDKGFITTHLEKNKKTQKIVELQQKGKDAIKILDADRDKNDEKLIKVLTPEEWEQLSILLTKIRDNM